MKAVLKNGLIYPKEKVPEDWTDGTELRVEKSAPASTESSDELDRWMADVQASANDMDPDDELILEKTVQENRIAAGTMTRR